MFAPLKYFIHAVVVVIIFTTSHTEFKIHTYKRVFILSIK